MIFRKIKSKVVKRRVQMYCRFISFDRFTRAVYSMLQNYPGFEWVNSEESFKLLKDSGICRIICVDKRASRKMFIAEPNRNNYNQITFYNTSIVANV
jgi:hypothetical protein